MTMTPGQSFGAVRIENAFSEVPNGMAASCVNLKTGSTTTAYPKRVVAKNGKVRERRTIASKIEVVACSVY